MTRKNTFFDGWSWFKFIKFKLHQLSCFEWITHATTVISSILEPPILKRKTFLKVYLNIQGLLFNLFKSCHRHTIFEILKCKGDSNLLNYINLKVACWVKIAEDPRNLYTNYMQVFLRQVKVNHRLHDNFY